LVAQIVFGLRPRTSDANRSMAQNFRLSTVFVLSQIKKYVEAFMILE